MGNPPIPVDPLSQAVQGLSKCLVIGNEGGFLAKPVAMPLNMPFNPVLYNGSLLMAPAERLDVVIDFTGYAGKTLILYNDAPAPFPVGAPGADFLPNKLGTGPNTREIMRFTVSAVPATTNLPVAYPLLPSDFTATLPVNGDAWNDLPLIYPTYNAAGFPVATPGVPPPTITRIRQLTLNEAFDPYGRLLQQLGTNTALPGGLYGRAYTDLPITENPNNGDTEIWEIANLTGDTHPIHFHLVNVQVLSRQAFDVRKYAGTPAVIGPPLPPDPDERGWKETVKMHPGQVTRVAMTFSLPPDPPNVVAIPGLGHLPCSAMPVITSSRALVPAATSTSGTATSWSTKSMT